MAKEWLATLDDPAGTKITVQDEVLLAFLELYPNAIVRAIVSGVGIGLEYLKKSKKQKQEEATANAMGMRVYDTTPDVSSNPPKTQAIQLIPKHGDRLIGDDDMGVTLTATGIGVQTWCQIRGGANTVTGFPGNSSRYVQWSSILSAAGKGLEEFLIPRYGQQFDGDILQRISGVMDDFDLHLAAGKLNDPRVGSPWNNLILFADTAELEGFISPFIERPGGPRKRRTFTRRRPTTRRRTVKR